MEFYKCFEGIALSRKKKYPFIAHEVVHNNEVVEVALNRLGLHGSSKIHVYEIKRAGTAVS